MMGMKIGVEGYVPAQPNGWVPPVVVSVVPVVVVPIVLIISVVSWILFVPVSILYNPIEYFVLEMLRDLSLLEHHVSNVSVVEYTSEWFWSVLVDKDRSGLLLVVVVVVVRAVVVVLVRTLVAAAVP